MKTFSTDEPIVLKSGDTTLRSKVTPGADGTVQVVPVEGGPPQVIALKDVAQINPPPVKWTGGLIANALVTRGNSETDNIGATFNAVRRSENDRITLGAGYYYGRQEDEDTGDKETTIDNWFVLGKYDYFLTKKLYVYGAFRAERDQIADLDLRLTAGLGLGYQWFETPYLNLFTEAGLAWVYEDYEDQDSENHCSRRGSPITWTGSRTRMLTLFHNLEWLPAFYAPVRRLQPEHGRGAAGGDPSAPSSPRPRSSSSTTRPPARGQEERRSCAFSSASAGRSTSARAPVGEPGRCGSPAAETES